MPTKSAVVDADNSWQAEDDLRTLTRAQEIMDDPKRLAKAMKLATKQQEELASLTKSRGLKAAKC